MQQELLKKKKKKEHIDSDKWEYESVCVAWIGRQPSEWRRQKAGEVLEAATTEQIQSPEGIVVWNHGLKF